MSNLKFLLGAGALFAGAALDASALELTWTGAAGTVWDRTSANWRTSDGAAAVFVDGAAVTVDDAAAAGLTLGTSVRPGSVTFDVANAFTLGFSGESVFQAGSGPFAKNGAGVLTLQATGGKQAFRGYAGKMDVGAGTLLLSGANQYASFGGLSTATFEVAEGARLQVQHRNCFGKVDDPKGCTANVVLHRGATFQLGPDGTAHTGNTVHDLTLDGGSVVFAGNGLGTRVGTLNVLGTLTVTGDVAQVVTDTSSSGNCRIGMAWQKKADGTATGVPRTVFDIADVTGDDLPDLTFEQPLTRGTDYNFTAGFVKKGAGTMRLAYAGEANASSPLYGRQLGANGDIDVQAGTLDFGGRWTFPVPNALVQNIYVGTNATLLISHPEAVCTDCLTTTQRRPLTRFHVDHGTFRIDCPGFETGHVFLGDRLVLEDAALETTLNGFADDNYALGALSLGSLLHVRGTKPCVLMPFTGMTNTRMALLCDPMTEVTATEMRIEDVTGDGAVDATIGYKLCDHRMQVSNGTSTLASGLVKTGRGTLLLAPSNTGLNTFSGNVDIREGVVRLDAPDPGAYSGSWFGQSGRTYLGDMKSTHLNAARTVTIQEGAALELGQRNMFSSYSYGETGGNAITTKFVVKGAVRFLRDNAINAFGDIVVDGGAFEYGTMPGNVWGPFNFRGTLKVTGDRPLVLPMTATPRLALYPSYACTFDVDDVTGNGAPDLVSHQSPCRPPDANYYDGSRTDSAGNPYRFTYGFVKRGAGTLALERAMRNAADFDAEARIEAGSVLFDDDFSKAGGTVVVRAGGAVGGTGSVAGITTFEAGAGLAGTAGQETPLVVSGDLVLPSTGFVDIHLPDGADPKTAKARVLRVEGELSTPSDFSGWAVRFDGQTVPGGRVVRSGNTLTAGMFPGTVLVFR